MTIEAHLARREALQFECKQDAIRKNQDGTVKLTLTISPTDFPTALMGDPMGQRYVAVLVALNDDETPKVRASGPSTGDDAPPEGSSPASSAAPSKRWEELLPSQQAGILCSEPDFFHWILSHYFWSKEDGDTDAESAAKWLRQECGVESRRDLNTCPEARETFASIVTSFHYRNQTR